MMHSRSATAPIGTPGIQVRRRVRTTRSGRPFRSGWAIGAELGVDLAEAGYVEDEVIVSGRANTYTYVGDWSRIPAKENVPYVTRVLIRRPENLREFGGLYSVEALHPGADHDPVWRTSHPWIIDKGHIWVGVTTTPKWAASMREQIDPERYADLSIPELGLGYDIVAQVISALRAGHLDPQLPYEATDRAILSGWSNTGTFTRMFAMEGFHRTTTTPDGAPAIDGYLIGISSGGFIDGGYVPLSEGTPRLPDSHPRRQVGRVGVPIMEVLSENEVETHGAVIRDDSDAPEDPYRFYAVAGSGHAAVRSRTGWPGDESSEAYGRSRKLTLNEQSSTFPFEYAIRAAYNAFAEWVQKGTLPPRAERIPFADSGPCASWPECRPLVRDEHGNAVGGVRSTYVDVPIARYYPHSTIAPPNPMGRNGEMFPHWVPFSPEKLTALYGTAETYRQRVRQRAAQLVAGRWLLASDARSVIAEAEALSINRGEEAR